MASSTTTVLCPICARSVRSSHINSHLDSNCKSFLETSVTSASTQPANEHKARTSFFPSSQAPRPSSLHESLDRLKQSSSPSLTEKPNQERRHDGITVEDQQKTDERKRRIDNALQDTEQTPVTSAKKRKTRHAPLAERMRPKTLDEVAGQEIVGPDGVLRNLIVTDRVPSMILWGGPGTGKTTIARLLAETAGTRFVEINSTSSGVGECKRLFEEAKNEQRLTGRKTIIFCDEIHRFSKSQQDVFLGPVEAGQVILVGATTENPSFKVVNALLSRCRTFTLSKLTSEDIMKILQRALQHEHPELLTPSSSPAADDTAEVEQAAHLLADNDHELLRYLAEFADGDARTALNLLELAIDLTTRPGVTSDTIKKSLTQTLVYDRAGDQHYDTISAFHKSVRGSNADAALYYLARMLQSGEDPLYIARRMVVIASEDVGLADNTMLSLATATYTAAEKIGMPECRINLAHCAVALALAPKSVRAYRGLHAAYAALKEPGVAGLPIPLHLRNAPTRLMKELGYGKAYKYNPNYVKGEVVQDYLPERLQNERFLGTLDLGEQVDEDLHEQAQDRDVGRLDPELEVLLGPDGD